MGCAQAGDEGTVKLETLNEYQQAAWEFAVYPNAGSNLVYAALGLGEVGEFQNQVKKVYRDDGGRVTEERRRAMLKELGDLMWYFAALCTELDCKLGQVMESWVRMNMIGGHDLKLSVLSRYASYTGLIAHSLGAQALKLGCIGDIQITVHNNYLKYEVGSGESRSYIRGAICVYIPEAVIIIERLADFLGSSLREVCESNIAKLKSRAEDNQLHGDGDDR